MSLELLDRGKRSGCLSAWQVSQLAVGLDLPHAAAHERGCPSCAERVVAEQGENQACSEEKVPTILLARAGTQPWRRRVRLPPVVLAALAAILAVALVARSAWLWWHAPGAAVAPREAAAVAEQEQVNL